MIRGFLIFTAGLAAMLGAGWVGFPYVLYERTAQPLQFNHKVHTDKGGMKCEDCHAVRDDGTFGGIPRIESCAGCHAEPMGTTAAEKQLIEKYVTPNREIPWQVYSRQPENVYFSHATHVKAGKVACTECHGQHGSSERLRVFERNRVSGYSRDIWGPNMARFISKGRPGMKMDDCIACHRSHGLTHSCMACHK